MHHLIGLRKELGPKVILICMISTVWFIGNMALEYFFPIYLEQAGLSFLELGFLLSLASLSGLLIDMPIGKLSDISDKKKLMEFGLLISPIFAFIVLHMHNFGALVIGLFMWGVGFQVWKIARDTYLAENAKPEHDAEALGAGEESLALGAVIGPVIAGFILIVWGGTGIWAVYTIFCIISAALVHKYIAGEGKSLAKGIAGIIKKHHFFREEMENFKIFGFEGIVLLYLAFLLMMIEYMIFVLEPLMYTIPGIDLTLKTGGLLLGAFSLPAIVLSIPFGRLADRIGKRKILITGILIEAAGLYLFSQGVEFKMLMLYALISASGFALALPALDGLIVDKTLHHKRGELVGIWGAFMDAGYIAGPLLAGILAYTFGIRTTLAIMAVILSVSTLFVAWLEERVVKGPKAKSLQRYRRKRYPISL